MRIHFLETYQIQNCLLTLLVRERIYAYANRLDPGQPLSNSAAGLRSNLFATQSIIPNKK